jgi:hypothetical protein
MSQYEKSVILSEAKDLNSCNAEVYSRGEILRASSSDALRMTCD